MKRATVGSLFVLLAGGALAGCGDDSGDGGPVDSGTGTDAGPAEDGGPAEIWNGPGDPMPARGPESGRA
jgi:hypothetical protein